MLVGCSALRFFDRDVKFRHELAVENYEGNLLRTVGSGYDGDGQTCRVVFAVLDFVYGELVMRCLEIYECISLRFIGISTNRLK